MFVKDFEELLVSDAAVEDLLQEYFFVLVGELGGSEKREELL